MVQEKKRRKKLEWVYDEKAQKFSVSDGCEDFVKYNMLSFVVTRCKDTVTHEESMIVQSLYDGTDNGSIRTSLESMGKDLGKLRKYGVALSSLQLGELKVEIDKVYLQMKVQYTNTPENELTAEELKGIMEAIAISLKEGKYLNEKGMYYMPVKDFEDLFDDSEMPALMIRKILLKEGYIEGNNGRTAILKKLDKKPVRVIAFYESKLPK